MEQIIVILSLILAVVLGGFIVTYLHASNKQKFIKLMISVSGGFLLSIAFNYVAANDSLTYDVRQ